MLTQSRKAVKGARLFTRKTSVNQFELIGLNHAPTILTITAVSVTISCCFARMSGNYNRVGSYLCWKSPHRAVGWIRLGDWRLQGATVAGSLATFPLEPLSLILGRHFKLQPTCKHQLTDDWTEKEINSRKLAKVEKIKGHLPFDISFGRLLNPNWFQVRSGDVIYSKVRPWFI